MVEKSEVIKHLKGFHNRILISSLAKEITENEMLSLVKAVELLEKLVDLDEFVTICEDLGNTTLISQNGCEFFDRVISIDTIKNIAKAYKKGELQ